LSQRATRFVIAGGAENCNLWHTHSLNDSEFIQKKREDPSLTTEKETATILSGWIIV
jgi:hypothetical protein